MYANCPIVWLIRIQTEIALSTVEAYCIDLSQAMRDVLPFVSLMKDIELVLKLQETPGQYCAVFSKIQSQFKKTIKE